MSMELQSGKLNPKHQALFEDAKKWFYANKNAIFHDEKNVHLRKSADVSS